MADLESTSQSFIVKIWVEETAEEAGEIIWRGHVTHVPSGERRYLRTLDDVSAFIEPYLLRLGVTLGLRSRRTWRRRSIA